MRGVAVAVELGGPGQTAPGIVELAAAVVPHLLADLAAGHHVGAGLGLAGPVDAEGHEGSAQQEGQARGAARLHHGRVLLHLHADLVQVVLGGGGTGHSLSSVKTLKTAGITVVLVLLLL